MGRSLLPWAAALLPCPLGAGGHNLPHVPSLLSGLGVWVGELSLGVVPTPLGPQGPVPSCALWLGRVLLCPVLVFWGHLGLPHVLLALLCTVTGTAPGVEGISPGAAAVP